MINRRGAVCAAEKLALVKCRVEAHKDGFAGLFFGFFLIAGDVHIAFVVVPCRDLMAPPQLARNTPVLDVVHPLVVGVDPIFRDKTYRAAVDGFFGFIGKA